MTCPYLEYLQSDEDHEFDHDRPWCGADESFVSPMRADICNDRFEFDHECDCEVYKRAVSEERQRPIELE
jgi:hypothetical protein